MKPLKLFCLIICFCYFYSVIPSYAAEPDYSNLPNGMEYLGPAGEGFPDGQIRVLTQDGIEAYFNYGTGPVQFFDDNLDTISTQDILQKILNTNELYDTNYTSVKNYSKHLDYYLWRYPELKEVFARSDLSETLVNVYRQINAAQQISEDSDSELEQLLAPVIQKNMQLSSIEYLMIMDQEQNGEYSVSEKSNMIAAFEEASTPLMPFSAFLSQTTLKSPYSTYQKYVMETGRFSCSFLFDDNEAAFPTLRNMDNMSPLYDYEEVQIRLPNNQIVIAQKGRPELTDLEKAAANTADAIYRNKTQVGAPTRQYNCHSYAWWAQTTRNQYWISNPAPFMTVGSGYVPVSTPRSGDIVYWLSDDHSAVYRYTMGTNLFLVTSKWGDHGLYEHASNNCPYKWDGYCFFRKE